MCVPSVPCLAERIGNPLIGRVLCVCVCAPFPSITSQANWLPATDVISTHHGACVCKRRPCAHMDTHSPAILIEPHQLLLITTYLICPPLAEALAVSRIMDNGFWSSGYKCLLRSPKRLPTSSYTDKSRAEH